jgi:hypothetical protein
MSKAWQHTVILYDIFCCRHQLLSYFEFKTNLIIDHEHGSKVMILTFSSKAGNWCLVFISLFQLFCWVNWMFGNLKRDVQFARNICTCLDLFFTAQHRLLTGQIFTLTLESPKSLHASLIDCTYTWPGSYEWFSLAHASWLSNVPDSDSACSSSVTFSWITAEPLIWGYFLIACCT